MCDAVCVQHGASGRHTCVAWCGAVSGCAALGVLVLVLDDGCVLVWLLCSDQEHPGLHHKTLVTVSSLGSPWEAEGPRDQSQLDCPGEPGWKNRTLVPCTTSLYQVVSATIGLGALTRVPQSEVLSHGESVQGMAL